MPPQAQAAAVMLTRVADDVANAMGGLVKKNLVVVRRKQSWIEVEIRTDILFPSGSAQLAPNAVDIIQRLADVLARFPNPIRVEGFTDNVPISTMPVLFQLGAVGGARRQRRARSLGSRRRPRPAGGRRLRRATAGGQQPDSAGSQRTTAG